MGTGGSFPEG